VTDTSDHEECLLQNSKAYGVPDKKVGGPNDIGAENHESHLPFAIIIDCR
jgi:hypothetical protein